MTAKNQSSGAFPFLILALPFFLNDLGFIYFRDSYSLYVIDYIVRLYVIMLCINWLAARQIANKYFEAPNRLDIQILTAFALLLFGRLTYLFLFLPIYAHFEWSVFFEFYRISNQPLYWFDLTIGLFLVALSEELVFRKFLFHWFNQLIQPSWIIVLVSALLFFLAHWGNGIAKLIYTFIIGAAYMLAYLKIKRLWPLILAHWMESFIVFGPL